MNEVDRYLSEKIDDYEPPLEEEMEARIDAAPHPRDAVEYPDENEADSSAVADGEYVYDPTNEFYNSGTIEVFSFLAVDVTRSDGLAEILKTGEALCAEYSASIYYFSASSSSV